MPEDCELIILQPENRAIFEQLLRSGRIEMVRGNLLYQAPSAATPVSFDRVEGMMLGLAIGDALGSTTEGKLPQERLARYGEIREYQRDSDEHLTSHPTDDTQLAFWTLEQMIADRGFVPDNIARRFCAERIRGIGSAVKEFVINYMAGVPWFEAGTASAGNGALMRIAPILIPHLSQPSPDLWVDTALATMITHNDSAAISSCLAFVSILWHLMHRKTIPDPKWWLEEYLRVAPQFETDKAYITRAPAFAAFQGTLSEFLSKTVQQAFNANLSVVDACQSWYSGAYLLETVPSVIYILMRYAWDPEEAIVRAVNDTKDNDTIAAIVGAAVGALHGRAGLPERWVVGLPGRVSGDDDGHLFNLLQQARVAWGFETG